MTAPLAGDATGLGPLLMYGHAIDDEDRVGGANLFGDVGVQLGPQGGVVPATLADELLNCSPGHAGIRRYGFGRVALQAGELAMHTQVR